MIVFGITFNRTRPSLIDSQTPVDGLVRLFKKENKSKVVCMDVYFSLSINFTLTRRSICHGSKGFCISFKFGILCLKKFQMLKLINPGSCETCLHKMSHYCVIIHVVNKINNN